MFPLGDNPELVSFLREGAQAARLSILLHGYSHQNYPTGYEFEVAPDLDWRLARGLECGDLAPTEGPWCGWGGGCPVRAAGQCPLFPPAQLDGEW